MLPNNYFGIIPYSSLIYVFLLFKNEMAGFTEAMLFKKLEDLNESQQSIQTLSLWLIHHRKHYQLIVKSWMKEMSNGMYYPIYLFDVSKNRCFITFISLAYL